VGTDTAMFSSVMTGLVHFVMIGRQGVEQG
jgi:hypothetical protein